MKFKNTGEYQFFKCEDCDGPILGHLQAKCRNGENYDDRTVTKFEGWLERIPEFRKHIEDKNQAEADKQAENQANILSHAVRRIVADVEPRNNANPTTQLVKSRWPPGWSGQKFDKWRTEIEKWSQNNKSTEEDKYMDLIESLKKNDTIKDFVTKSLIEKVGETRTVDQVLNVMAEKYSKTTCEKIKDTMKKISEFKTNEKVDNLIDNFDEMLIEIKTLDLARRLEYAVSAQFVDRLEENGKINTMEKLRLKDILEDPEGNPRDGDTTEVMKRELKRLKIIDHREEPFANKDTLTNYVRNDENRSRYDDWRKKIRSEGYRRSESNPKFFRTASKNNWKRDNSKFSGRSSSRPYRDSSRFRSK